MFIEAVWLRTCTQFFGRLSTRDQKLFKALPHAKISLINGEGIVIIVALQWQEGRWWDCIA
jgi:hypothetical protein